MSKCLIPPSRRLRLEDVKCPPRLSVKCPPPLEDLMHHIALTDRVSSNPQGPLSVEERDHLKQFATLASTTDKLLADADKRAQKPLLGDQNPVIGDQKPAINVKKSQANRRRSRSVDVGRNNRCVLGIQTKC